MADVDLIRIASGKSRSALRWAELAHRGVQRKGAPFAYLTHVVAVADVLAGAGADRNVVAAGYLHDTVEDTTHLPELPVGAKDEDGQYLPRKVTIGDIREEFGYSVSVYVNAVTKGPEMVGLALPEQAPVIMRKLLSVCADPDVDDPAGGLATKGADSLVNMDDLVWDAEEHGVAHFAEIFTAQRAEMKCRHYIRLSGMIAEQLRRRRRYEGLADALDVRAAELRVLADEYLALEQFVASSGDAADPGALVARWAEADDPAGALALAGCELIEQAGPSRDPRDHTIAALISVRLRALGRYPQVADRLDRLAGGVA